MDEEESNFPEFINAIDKSSTDDLIHLCAHNQAAIVNLIDEIKDDASKLDVEGVLGSVLAEVLVLFAIIEKHMRDCVK